MTRQQALLSALRATHLTRPQLRRQLLALEPHRRGTSQLRKLELQEALAAAGAKRCPSPMSPALPGWGWLA